MTGPTLGPVMVSERIASVDIVRGFALWGVLLINMMNYGALNTHRWSGPIDRLAFWAQRFFFEQKSWRLFSFLFGFGFALLLIRASTRGARFLPMYVRRLIILLGFGFFSFLFGPDIISVYAVLGFGLLLFHRWSPRWLLLVAALLLLVNPVYTVVPKVPSGPVENRAVVNRAVPAIISIPEKDLAGLTGLYVDPTSVRSIRLYMKDGKLIVAWSGEPPPPVTAGHLLSPVSQDRFLTGARNEVEIVFMRPTAGGSMQVKVILGGQTTTLDAVQSVTPTPGQLAEFAGKYVSDELAGATYTLSVKNGKLVMEVRTGITVFSDRGLVLAVTQAHGSEAPKDILLTPAFADAFEFVDETIRIVRFTRNQQNAVSGFTLTSGAVRRVRFNKL